PVATRHIENGVADHTTHIAEDGDRLATAGLELIMAHAELRGVAPNLNHSSLVRIVHTTSDPSTPVHQAPSSVRTMPDENLRNVGVRRVVHAIDKKSLASAGPLNRQSFVRADIGRPRASACWDCYRVTFARRVEGLRYIGASTGCRSDGCSQSCGG